MERRSRSSAAAAAALVIALQVSMSAHRRDEYLQAARVALQPDGVAIQLDLTPGIEVADAIIGAIDRDRSGALSNDEQLVYADQVVRALDARVDGEPLRLQLVSSAFPDPSSMRGGEGTIRLQVTAPHRVLAGGAHQLVLRNAHHPAPSVYLANALVPGSARVSIVEQRRDPQQTELTIDYMVRGTTPIGNGAWVLAGLPLAAALLFRLSRRVRADQPGTVQ
jgi:hypothetical protein